MSVNLSNTTPAAPTGSTNVTWQTDGAGNVSAYVTTAVEIVGAGVDATAQNANIPAANLIASPTAGQYRVSAYIIVTTVASTGAATSTLPSVVITWNDKDNAQPQTITLTPTNSGNLLTTYQENDAILSVSASAPLQYSTTGYASNTASQMQYALHIRVEAL
jgi:hypothetical protein